MKGKVTIATWEAGELVGAEVAADLTDHLAIHRGEGWIVTHRASGLAMAWLDTKEQAKAMAVMWEWSHGDDLRKLAKLEFGKAPAKKTSAWSACRRLYRARQQWMADNG